MTKFTIRPFNDHDLTDDVDEAHQRKLWNKKLSKLRIFVEHAFGRLKGRFPHLRQMTGYDLEDMYRSIEAVMIIHNILEAFGDDPTTIRGFNGLEDDDIELVRGQGPAQLDVNLGEDDLYRTGLFRRKQLLIFSQQDEDYADYNEGTSE